MKVDLHCHSHFSDGKHAPDFLLTRAVENRLTHLAITDHDCITVSAAFDPATSPLQLISGVEISCDWEGKEIHVVGLFVDPQHSTLRELLGSQQASRQNRIGEMDKRLRELGVEGLWEHMSHTECLAYTRSHVADFLVSRRICKNRQKAFKSWLGKRGRIYVAPHWCSMQQAISTILDAGGIAVLAHPGRYPLGRGKLQELIDEFARLGGEAIEGSYGNIDHNTNLRLCKAALERNLYISVGSDFHDIEAYWTDIGKYPALNEAAKKNAIWEHPKWHSLYG